MKSEAVLLAATLVLLITAPSTFADAASSINTKAEKETAAPKEAKPAAEKAEEKPKKAKAKAMPKEENRGDPCRVEPDLPGCTGVINK